MPFFLHNSLFNFPTFRIIHYSFFQILCLSLILYSFIIPSLFIIPKGFHTIIHYSKSNMERYSLFTLNPRLDDTTKHHGTTFETTALQSSSSTRPKHDLLSKLPIAEKFENK